MNASDSSSGSGCARLTPTEQRLLDVLRSRAGETLTRRELVELVMPDAIVLERTIDVHVRALRAKLGALRGCVQTIRGVGYRYVKPDERPDFF